MKNGLRALILSSLIAGIASCTSIPSKEQNFPKGQRIYSNPKDEIAMAIEIFSENIISLEYDTDNDGIGDKKCFYLGDFDGISKISLLKNFGVWMDLNKNGHYDNNERFLIEDLKVPEKP